MTQATTYLLQAATGTGAGSPANVPGCPRTFQAYGKTTAGAGAVAVDILGSNIGDIAAACLLGTISLTLSTTNAGDGFVSTAPWDMVWARVNSISGTGAAVTVVAAS